MSTIKKPHPAAESIVTASNEQTTSKLTKVLSMLQAEGGSTLPELVAATGWQPHTARAALSGLKKKGHAIEREKVDGVSCYRIGKGAGQ